MHDLRESTGKIARIFYPLWKNEMDQDTMLSNGPGVGRSFAERLLLSIIDAHPNPEEYSSDLSSARDREKRLQTAMQALFGKAKTGRKPDPDDAILRWMGSEHYRDKAIVKMQSQGLFSHLPVRVVRSDRILAQEAEKQFSLAAGAHERLRKKFREQHEFWLEIERSHDDIAELMDTWLIDEIRAILSRRDIASIPNWPDGLPRDFELENKSDVVQARRKLITALCEEVGRIQQARLRTDYT
jgi:hypothetical protein